MCGIVAVIGSREAAPLLVDGLRNLEYRGYDSSGIATVQVVKSESSGTLTTRKVEGKFKNLIELINKKGAPGHLGIGHTRWATHGKPAERNAHPHLDASGQVAVVQNGIIENHLQLREKLQDKGIKFISETDTEVIPNLVTDELTSCLREGLPINGSTLLLAVQRVLSQLQGTYAIAIIWSKVPDALVVARRQAPLIIGLGEGEFFCASDTPALVGFTRTVLPMKDNEVALLTPLGIELYDLEGNRQQRKPSALEGAEHIADKRDFRHFMLKEIHEQPETAALWIAKHLPHELPLDTPIALSIDDSLFEGIKQIQILACGTSRHAAMVGAYLLEQFAGIPTAVFYASEFRYSPPPLAPHTLTIGVSQSGETADTLAALAMEDERRQSMDDPTFASRQLGITNRLESSLARQVVNILDTGAGIEIGVAATKTFLGQMLSFYGLTLRLAAKNKTRLPQEIGSLINELRLLPEQLREIILKHDDICESFANQFTDTKDVIFLGRGINFPIALEGALKLKEISYIHAQGYPAGELKHGPIALLDKNVPVISIAVPGRVYEKVINNSEEAKARDAKLIGISVDSIPSGVFDYTFSIPKVSEWISPLLTIVPLQLFSYHIAANKGLDVDQPRNLAKSVTVE